MSQGRNDRYKKVQEVRGDLIRQVREERKLTKGQVQAVGGPSKSYQSEVEHGKKAQVSPSVLYKWASILGVSVDFLRGKLHRADQPGAAGLYGQVATLVRQQFSPADWTSLPVLTRVTHVLSLTLASSGLSKLELAHVLYLEVPALDDMLHGAPYVTDTQIEYLANLTTLSKSFILSGPTEDEILNWYRDEVMLAHAMGLSPSDLRTRILGG